MEIRQGRSLDIYIWLNGFGNLGNKNRKPLKLRGLYRPGDTPILRIINFLCYTYMTKVYEFQGQKVALGLRKGDGMTENSLAVLGGKQIRRYYDENTQAWYFSIVDIIQVLLQQSDYQTLRKYWNKLKERLKKEGNESVTKCHRLKLEAADGKKCLTNAAS
jgi:hypothetical protein